MDLLLHASFFVFVAVSLLWLLSVFLKNVSIIDTFWGISFVLVNAIYLLKLEEIDLRSWLITVLVSAWGLRLSIHLVRRNWGKGEDFRYREFRRTYGAQRYWWFSYFQTFLLQGTLILMISLPLLGVHTGINSINLNIFDYLGLVVYLIGFVFETGSDIQLKRFKRNPLNKGKVLKTGLWRYTRHPNYFGDSAIWWAFGLFSIASGNYWHLIGSAIMTFLLIKISGVSMLERTLIKTKPKYAEYIKSTNAFFPWFPNKINRKRSPNINELS